MSYNAILNRNGWNLDWSWISRFGWRLKPQDRLLTVQLPILLIERRRNEMFLSLTNMVWMDLAMLQLPNRLERNLLSFLGKSCSQLVNLQTFPPICLHSCWWVSFLSGDRDDGHLQSPVATRSLWQCNQSTFRRTPPLLYYSVPSQSNSEEGLSSSVRSTRQPLLAFLRVRGQITKGSSNLLRFKFWNLRLLLPPNLW